MKNSQNDLKIIKIHPVLAEIDADSARGVPIFGSRGPKIWTPTFLDTLVPNQPKSTIKSILASKSYESCLDDMSYHTINTDSQWHSCPINSPASVSNPGVTSSNSPCLSGTRIDVIAAPSSITCSTIPLRFFSVYLHRQRQLPAVLNPNHLAPIN